MSYVVRANDRVSWARDAFPPLFAVSDCAGRHALRQRFAATTKCSERWLVTGLAGTGRASSPEPAVPADFVARAPEPRCANCDPAAKDAADCGDLAGWPGAERAASAAVLGLVPLGTPAAPTHSVHFAAWHGAIILRSARHLGLGRDTGGALLPADGACDRRVCSAHAGERWDVRGAGFADFRRPGPQPKAGCCRAGAGNTADGLPASGRHRTSLTERNESLLALV